MDKPLPLEVTDLSLNFGGIQALEGVNFQLRPGEILGLVGPNGAGKTCILNVVSGIYRPTRGKVLFEGKDLIGLRSHEIAVMGIARTFQNVELFPKMTVLENLLLGCHKDIKSNIFSAGVFWGWAQKDECAIRRRVEDVIDFLELEMYRKLPAAGLPLGARKLVGLGRALVMQPRVLLLDEPSSGMNRPEKEDFARFLLRIKYELAIPMLWVEHDMKLIGDLADRLVVLHYGKKIAEGDIREVIADPGVIEAYIGKKLVATA
ncbi:MAG: ABC transporter ATP-binding protein [Chloroflexi bacterium]|nr:ABC transporter ATP-binding protein [Chloroflexota bacterium]